MPHNYYSQEIRKMQLQQRAHHLARRDAAYQRASQSSWDRTQDNVNMMDYNVVSSTTSTLYGYRNQYGR